jgi:hypothetical protein
MSTLKVTTLQNLSGVEVYTAKAWVNFNGTGTVAIRAQGNVSSITDNGTGDYTVNFTNALTDANFSCVASASVNDGGFAPTAMPTTYTSSSIRIYVYADGIGFTDRSVAVACFR